jgi:hypothetical protein
VERESTMTDQPSALPREWWIWIDRILKTEMLKSEPPGELSVSYHGVHVVENTVYDAKIAGLEGELREAKMEAEKWRNVAHHNGGTDYETLRDKTLYKPLADKLAEELAEAKTEIANQNEELAEALGEVGIDVSNCYDFAGMLGLMSALVHEVEVEKVELKLTAARKELAELKDVRLQDLKRRVDGILTQHRAELAQVEKLEGASEG